MCDSFFVLLFARIGGEGMWGVHACRGLSKRRYMKIIADIIGVTVDIFEKSLIYLGRYRVEYTRAEI